jgi:hypothetical protein
VIGYDFEKRVYELIRQNIGEGEEIRYISFLEDLNPTFIFLVTFDKNIKKSFIKILKLKKNKEFGNT